MSGSAPQNAQVEIDLTKVTWERDCTFDALYDAKQNAMIRVLNLGKPVVVLKYEDIEPEQLSELRSKWAHAYANAYNSDSQEAGIQSGASENVESNEFVPVTNVTSLPELEMWETQTDWHEDAFWATPEMRLCVSRASDTGSKIDLVMMGGHGTATYTFSRNGADDELVHNKALKLREGLHLKNQIRIETEIRSKLSCYYIPKRNL